MLFTRWDLRRQIFNTLPFHEHLRPAIAHLAYWIYSDPRNQSGVLESQLISSVIEYIQPRLYDDPEKARFAAKQFITFCTGRAWVFTDTGTTASGERLYEFTHRTFLEYFTALYLARNFPSPDKLIDLLLPRIMRQEWEMVAHLACQILSKQQESAADEIILKLMDMRSGGAAPEQDNLLKFAARALQYIVPSPRVRRSVTEAAFEIYWNMAQDTWSQLRPSYFRGGMGQHQETDVPSTSNVRQFASDVIATLLLADRENKDTIYNSIDEFLANKLNTRNITHAALVFETINTIAGMPGFGQLSDTDRVFWQSALLKAQNAKPELYRATSRKYFSVGWNAVVDGFLDIRDFCESHGLNSLTWDCRHPFVSYYNASIMWVIAVNLAYIATTKAGDALLKMTEGVGRLLGAVEPPWFPAATGYDFRFMHEKSKDPAPTERVAGDLLFGCFVAAAIFIEASKEPQKDLAQHLRAGAWIFSRFYHVFSRYAGNGSTSDDISTELADAAFSGGQRAIVLKWVHREGTLLRGSTGLPRNRRRAG
jgi:hypothetical protein